MAETGGIRAGKAFVEAYLNDTKLQQGLASAQRRMKAWGASMNAMGTKVMMVGTAMLAPLMGSVAAFMKTGDNLNKMAIRTGVSVEQLSALGFAAQQSGASLDDLANAMFKMNRRLGRITEGHGSGQQVAAMEALGLSLEEIQAMNPEQRFMALAEAMASYGDDAAAAGLAQRAFGTGVDKLLPLLLEGRAGIEKLTDEAHRLGVVMSGEGAQAAADLTDAWSRVTNSAKMVVVQIGGALAPALKDIFGDLTALLGPAVEWIKHNRESVVAVAKLAAAAVVLGAGLKVLGIAMTLLAAHPVVLALAATAAGAIALHAVLGDLTKVVIGLTAAWAVFTLNPILLGLTAVAAAAIYLSEAFGTAGASAEAFSDKADKALAAGDKRRSAAMGQMQQLQGLAEKERLNNQEMARAQSLINALTKTYGDLGLSINTTTGKIVGMTKAQVEANAQDREAVRLALQADLLEGERNLGKAQQQYIGGEITHEDLKAKAEVWHLRAMSLKARLKSLELGEKSALTGTAGAPGGLTPEEATGKAKDEAEKRLKESLRYSLDLFNRQQQIRLGMIEDAHQREIELINQKYDHEIKAAELAGKVTGGLEQTRQLELSAARKRHAAEEAEESEEVADHEAGLREEIARAEINASAMTAESKRKALLDLDRKAALAEAARLGIDPELVERKYDLLRMGTAGHDALGQAKVSTTGGFSAYGVARGVGGYDIQTRIAKAGEDAAKTLQQLLTEAKNAQLVFG